jgi:hypothetical protein
MNRKAKEASKYDHLPKFRLPRKFGLDRTFVHGYHR